MTRTKKTKHVKGNVAEWDDNLIFTAGPDTRTMSISVYDHRTFGKDKLLGEGTVEIWRHLTPTAGVAGADVTVELTEGHGLLQLRLEFESGVTVNRSVNSFDYGSPSRFSIRKRSMNISSDADSHKS